MVNAQALKKFILPGLIFQSVVIAGGYGTGREIAEFFLTLGPASGLIAMAISMLIWSAVSAVSFEFARQFRSFDYRAFFVQLLGRGWFLFEICYVLQLMLVLAVIAAAAGSILQEVFALPYALGVVGMMAAVGFLVFRGSAAIEKFLTGWSVLLYIAYGILFVWSMSRFGDAVLSSFTSKRMPPLDFWCSGAVPPLRSF